MNGLGWAGRSNIWYGVVLGGRVDICQHFVQAGRGDGSGAEQEGHSRGAVVYERAVPNHGDGDGLVKTRLQNGRSIRVSVADRHWSRVTATSCHCLINPKSPLATHRCRCRRPLCPRMTLPPILLVAASSGNLAWDTFSRFLIYARTREST